jgi:hypothetical protein
MPAKKKNSTVIEQPTVIEEAPKTVFTAEEKRAMVSNYKTAEDQILLLEKRLEEAKRFKSDVCFELQKAFGNKKFTIDGIPCQVISHKYDGKDEATYYLKRQTNEEIVDHF